MSVENHGRLSVDSGAGNMLGASGAIGAAINIARAESVAFQLKWTGTPSGTFKVQVSCDSRNAVDSATTWADVSSATATASGSAGDGLIDVKTGARWARVFYTRSSSDGGIQVDYQKKGPG